MNSLTFARHVFDSLKERVSFFEGGPPSRAALTSIRVHVSFFRKPAK